MAAQSTSELYKAVCAERKVKVNPYVSQSLKKTPLTGKFTLKLPGNVRQVQRLSDDDVLDLCKCLQHNKCVTGLDLRYNNITNEGVEHLAKLLQEEKSSLSCLDLMFNDIQANGAQVLASSLQGNSTLLSLRLSGNKIGRGGGLELASMLQENCALQELEVADCDLDTSSIIALIIMLQKNKALCSVDISRPLLFSHQEEWAVHCSKMLAVNSSLMELHLGRMGMTDTGIEQLTEGLGRNHSLRYLDLCSNHVTCDGAFHLAMMLTQNRALEILDLSSNQIGDGGAGYLSKAITCPRSTLKELSVCRNNITSEGLLLLAQAVKSNSTLTHMYIWGNHLEEPVCQAFKELISSGRLHPEQTDVSPYEVDGHVFLAEVFQRLRKPVYNIDCNGTDVPTKTAASPDSTAHHGQLKDYLNCKDLSL
ncbi:leucine-rich repeat-containing protein 34 isoform X1 [Haplochromis burtoni]|nr:leucine-rich repeat-containing protein 34 isoform X1 [Haplochromis burtoni]